MLSVAREDLRIEDPAHLVTMHPEGYMVLSLLRPVDSLSSSHPLTGYRPDLAEGAELLGEAPGTGFAQKMWLVQYYGRFIQLTELLYRVAEYCDGTNSLADIAAEVSWTTQWQINADDVEYLLTKKLIPIGIITVSPEAEDSYVPARTEAQSLLRLGLRTKMIGARAIEPIAKRLQVLFTPVILIPLLVASAIAHGWLYLDHGVGGILSHAFYTPGLLLLIFAITILPSFWHEFGHASALRYGGGRARGIGVGIYIMDPAFYTDVTDSYRLGKAARIRTGLGGIYFDLIFSTMMIGAYVLTGWTSLVILVILSNLNTVYQFVPLVRLDGYWVLADLTGVPDFFALIGPFLRSVLPLSFWKAPKLPPLKRSAKIFLGIYTIIGVPGMFVFLYFFAAKIPGILTTSLTELSRQSLLLFIALYNGSWLNVAALQAQLFMLAVTLIGLTYFIFTLSRTYLTLIVKLLANVANRLRPSGELMRSRVS